jgi:hypothetical protein
MEIPPVISLPDFQPAIRQSIETPPEVIQELSEIFRAAGFMVKDSPIIEGLRPDLFAIGSDEVLWLGLACNQLGEITAKESGDGKWKSDGGALFDSPVRALGGAASNLSGLFDETLDAELKITVRAFVFMNGGTIANADSVRPVWDAFGISVVGSAEELRELIGTNRVLPSSEKEDFDAFSEYIDTAANYFNTESV